MERSETIVVSAESTNGNIDINTNPSDRCVIRVPSAPILKLAAIYWDDILEWVTLKDLNSLGKTCKRLNQVTGVHFQENYSTLDIKHRDDGLYCGDLHLDAFTHYIQDLHIKKQFQANCSDFLSSKAVLPSLPRQLKELKLTLCLLSPLKFERITNLFSEIASLKLTSCFINCNLHDEFLKHYPKLNRIYLRNCELRSDWLLHQYPILETFGLISNKGDEIVELKKFFEHNLCGGTFETNVYSLQTNFRVFLASDVNLNELCIHELFFRNENIREISPQLIQLHNRGFYKRLNLHVDQIDNDLVENLVLLPGLNEIGCNYISGAVILPVLPNARQFRVRRLNNTQCATSIKYFENLQCIEIIYSFFGQMLALIQQCRMLQKFTVENFVDGIDINKCSIDLIKLNIEREKVIHAPKVNIYMARDVFLATKYKCEVNLRRVELRPLIRSNHWCDEDIEW